MILTQKGLTNRKFDVGDLVLVQAAGSFVDVVTDVKKGQFQTGHYTSEWWHKNKDGKRIDTVDDLVNRDIFVKYMPFLRKDVVKKIREMEKRQNRKVLDDSIVGI